MAQLAMEPAALEFLWIGTSVVEGVTPANEAQLNWIWLPDMRVHTAGHWTGTGQPPRPTEVSLTTGIQCWGWFTVALTETMPLGMTRHSRRGQEKCAAGEKQQKIRHQQQVKTACRGGIVLVLLSKFLIYLDQTGGNWGKTISCKLLF